MSSKIPVETVLVSLDGVAVATQAGSPIGGGAGTLQILQRSEDADPPNVCVVISHMFGFRTAEFHVPVARWPLYTQDERKAAFIVGHMTGWGSSGEGRNAECGPPTDPARVAEASWASWINRSGDDGKHGASRQSVPHPTQQGAATPGQGATAQGAARAAGNVAEPQIGRTPDPADHPSSPALSARHPACQCHQEPGDSACNVHGIETDLGILVVPCAVCKITTDADDPAGAQWVLATDGWRCAAHRDGCPSPLATPGSAVAVLVTLRECRDAFRQFSRNGRWGSCNRCPRVGTGHAFPEHCSNTRRYDHQLDARALANYWESLRAMNTVVR